MKVVIIGTDFVYDSQGNLKPIEINTNVGYAFNKIESDDDVFDMAEFENFVTSNGFNKITYLGVNHKLREKLTAVCTKFSLEFDSILLGYSSITVPYIEDTPSHLIIRTSYDTTAVLDEQYCKDKVNYLNLIKDTEFGSEFAYMDESGQLINNITTIPDNGIHPNFILKAVLPGYDKNVYPKFYKVSNETELNTILQNVTSEYFLMPYYFNPAKTYNDKITKLRKLSMLYPPELQSIHIGSYTDITTEKINQNVSYSTETFELDNLYRNIYFTGELQLNVPKLMDDDYVIMADGTTKSGLDLQVGDYVKTIDIPNSDNIDVKSETTNYKIDLNTFLSGVIYTTNKVLNKRRVDNRVEVGKITFTDSTNWFDTIFSTYLIYNNNEVQFKRIKDFTPGDIVLLIDTSDLETVQTIQKTVQSVETVYEEFSGWKIEVEREHLFLTATNNPNSSTPSYFASFAAVEHNNATCFGSTPFCGDPGSCLGKTCCCDQQCLACQA